MKDLIWSFRSCKSVVSGLLHDFAHISCHSWGCTPPTARQLAGNLYRSNFQLCHSSDHKCLPCVKWHDIAQNGYIATINLAHSLNEWYKSYFGVLNWWDVCSWVTNAQGAPARAVQNLCLELKSALQQHCLKVLGPTYGDIFAHLAITPLRKNENKKHNLRNYLQNCWLMHVTFRTQCS